MSQFRIAPGVAWLAVALLVLSNGFAGPTPGVRAAAGPPRPPAVTYNKHVAPILFKHCATCHRPGEVGPFPLLTYKDAAKRADFLKEVTADRRMPPWKPVPGHGEFQGARRLSDAEINTLARWADAGAAQGDPKDLPPLPRFSEGWQLGKPDLILKMPKAFTIPAGGRDIYRAFVIPTGVTERRAVAAVEFRPGNRRVVHHARFFLDTTGAGRKKEEAESEPGFPSSGANLGVPISGSLGGWVPGTTPRFLPDGVARRLPRNSDLVLQVHYKPTGKEEKDQSTVGIFFRKAPVWRFLHGMMLAEPRLRIPAGEKRYRATASYTLPVAIRVLTIGSHMHLLGREMKVTAMLPGGKKEPLLWITDWDFNWQGHYHYVRPVVLPQGTVLKMEAFFDNSEKNPKNPHRPPRTVWQGPRTVDEMCQCPITFIVGSPREAMIVLQDLERTRSERRRVYQKWLREQGD
jgi:mono/diheme cytochrome c family protein